MSLKIDDDRFISLKIFDGKLSKPINTNEVDITKLGLLMGGKNE